VATGSLVDSEILAVFVHPRLSWKKNRATSAKVSGWTFVKPCSSYPSHDPQYASLGCARKRKGLITISLAARFSPGAASPSDSFR
jgi:hypothetical protein